MVKSLNEMVAERSEFGAKKYQVPNPDPSGPWGDGDTIELFWLRDLSQDMREELADAEVYAQRLERRVVAEAVSSSTRRRVDDLLVTYRYHVSQAFVRAAQLGELLEREAPMLTTDDVEYWGKFSRRL